MWRIRILHGRKKKRLIFGTNDSPRPIIINDEFPRARRPGPRGRDGAGGDSNAANGPSSRFATRLTIKFDFSWHHGDRRGHARVKSHGILSKIISVPRTKITRATFGHAESNYHN